MSLIESRGNMYEFVTHCWNTIKGACYHDCSYCYMKRWGQQKPVRFDEKELKTDLGSGNFIFVGSSCDMWANGINQKWINKTLNHCAKFDNDYFFQSKNPDNFLPFMPDKSHYCTTIETNRIYPKFMGLTPNPDQRAYIMGTYYPLEYLTIEPIMDFDLVEFIEIIKYSQPKQVNIGADSGNNHLPEPPKEKILELISELQKFTVIHNKSNLKRLLI